MLFTNPDNAQRAEWAGQAIETFKRVTGTDDCDALGDLLCNLMHHCAQNEIDFLAHLNQGALHFQAEIEIEAEGESADPSACAVNPHHYQRHRGMAARSLFNAIAAAVVQPADDPEDETIDGDMSEPDDEFCVFDSESPEGRAVADGRLNADGSDTWQATACVEGWNIYQDDEEEKKPLRLRKRDQDDNFETDADAWQHVYDRAKAGSKPHIEALEYLKRESESEYGDIIAYCE